ncbi:MAG: CHAT domain-containing protein, partial [Methylococcales bacterium]
QGRYAEAEPLYRRSLAIKEKPLGPEHPDVTKSLFNLAILYGVQGRYGEALPLIRQATALMRTRVIRASGERTSGALSEQRTWRSGFVTHVQLLRTVGGDQPDAGIISEAFEVAQLARASETAQAVAAMAARFSSGDNEFAQLVKNRQDALQRWKLLDSQLVQAFSKPAGERTSARESQLREELSSTDQQITDLDKSIQQRFPEYQNLTNPAPLQLPEAQKHLAPHEAMLSYLVGDKESYVWLVRQDHSEFRKIEIGKDALNKTITALRQQLDATSGLQTFAVADSHALYKQVVAPVEPLLNDVTHLIVVPDGALQSFPFGVLVSEDPKAAAGDPPRYREVAWLVKKVALSVLPSEASLRALRQFAKGNLGNQPFTGFGDPVLQGSGQARGANLAALYSRGPIADVNQVRQLQSLPETADELYGIARTLGADRDTVHLREAATETSVKGMDFTPYRNLAFSTHGLVAGDFKGLAEPALVLTPPEKGTELDDGLLTASEAAQLKLNADWVILSACNTAAPDGTPGAEGLSGLARAFFYAGSRALLVSHWLVDSNATVALTTGMFKEAAANPGIGKAEALRRSMLALLNDQDHPDFAHPYYWAPFVVVGEGGVQSSPQGLKKWLKTMDQFWRNLIRH